MSLEWFESSEPQFPTGLWRGTQEVTLIWCLVDHVLACCSCSINSCCFGRCLRPASYHFCSSGGAFWTLPHLNMPPVSLSEIINVIIYLPVCIATWAIRVKLLCFQGVFPSEGQYFILISGDADASWARTTCSVYYIPRSNHAFSHFIGTKIPESSTEGQRDERTHFKAPRLAEGGPSGGHSRGSAATVCFNTCSWVCADLGTQEACRVLYRSLCFTCRTSCETCGSQGGWVHVYPRARDITWLSRADQRVWSHALKQLLFWNPKSKQTNDRALLRTDGTGETGDLEKQSSWAPILVLSSLSGKNDLQTGKSSKHG